MSSLPKDYAFVTASGLATCVLVQGLAGTVSRARKKYNVPLPTMYVDTENKYNCIQRVHQHTLEEHPSILLMMAIGGLEFPRTSAGLGCLWVLGRIAFAVGYSTGEPKKRIWGCFGYAANIGLFAISVAFTLKKLELIK